MLSHSSIISVSIVPQSRHNVFIFIEMTVNSSSNDTNLRILSCHGSQSFRAAHKVEEHDIFCFHSMILLIDNSICVVYDLAPNVDNLAPISVAMKLYNSAPIFLSIKHHIIYNIAPNCSRYI